MGKTNNRSLAFRYYYYDADCDKEESYLNKKSFDGWNLQGVTANMVFNFQKSNSNKPMLYKIDYQEIYSEDYINLAQDAGWTLAAVRKVSSGAWYYFCHEISDDAPPALFSDTSSKISIQRRIQKCAANNINFSILIAIAAAALNLLTLLAPDNRTPDFVLGFASGFILGLSLVSIVITGIVHKKAGAKIRALESNSI